MIEKIKNNPKLKRIVLWLISSEKDPKPRLWVKLFVNPFFHHKGKGTLFRKRHARHDLFPWHKFDVGNDTVIEDYTLLNNGAGDLIIGKDAFIGIGTVIIGPVKIADKVLMGQRVFIAGFNHNYNDINLNYKESGLTIKEVTIGRESFLGTNSIVVAGVSIGEHVQIGAGSVVTKDIPSYTIAAGNPAKVIKRYDFEKHDWVAVK
jgi:acetyltransferase-like isoleucine patch superfamily enzyme